TSRMHFLRKRRDASGELLIKFNSFLINSIIQGLFSKTYFSDSEISGHSIMAIKKTSCEAWRLILEFETYVLLNSSSEKSPRALKTFFLLLEVICPLRKKYLQ